MNIYDFIQNEFKSIAVKEAIQLLNSELANTLISKIDNINFGDEQEDIEEKLDEIEKIEDFKKLKLTNTISNFLLNLYYLDYEINDFKRIQKLLDNHPDNKLIPLIWIYYQLNAFEQDEIFDIDVANFFQILFNNHDYLINLNDFFEETGIEYITLPYSRLSNSPEMFYQVFKDAEKKYPQSIFIKKLLGVISYYKKSYSESVKILQSLLKFISESTKEVDNLLYIEVMEYLALSFDKLGDDIQTEEWVEKIMSNLPNDGENEYIDYTVDAFFLRMRLNIKKGEKQKIFEDYSKIKKGVYSDALQQYETEYPDVMKYIETNNV